jgi:hypothetical protein
MIEAKYQVVTKFKLEDLVVEVNKLLGWGWVCQGGITSFEHKQLTKFSQAMMLPGVSRLDIRDHYHKGRPMEVTGVGS